MTRLLHLVQQGGGLGGAAARPVPLLAVPNVIANYQRPVYQLCIHREFTKATNASQALMA